MAAKMAEYMGAKRGDILPPYARISQLDRKRTAPIRYLGLLTCEEMYFANIFLERSSPLNRDPRYKGIAPPTSDNI